MILGDTNQAGEDSRNVARNALLLAGLPVTVPGQTVNRLCASGLGAVIDSARAISCGEGELYIAGGVESMSRAPFVMGKAESAYSRDAKFMTPPLALAFQIKKLLLSTADIQCLKRAITLQPSLGLAVSKLIYLQLNHKPNIKSQRRRLLCR